MTLDELIISDVTDMVTSKCSELDLDPGLAQSTITATRRKLGGMFHLAKRHIRAEETLAESFPAELERIEEESFGVVMYEDELFEAACNAAMLLYMTASPQPGFGRLEICLN